MNREIEYRGFRVIQVPAAEMAPLLKCEADEAIHRLSINGMEFPHAYIVRDDFDEDPMPLPCMWFEAPITAKAAIDIHLYGEGFQKAFWPNYHDVYIAMRNVPAILRALQEVHRASVDECENNIEIEHDSFAFRARERLARCFTEMEGKLTGEK